MNKPIPRHILENTLKRASVIWIYPEDMNHLFTIESGKFIGPYGNWDTGNRLVTSTIIFKGFKQRLEGADWKSTKFYKHYRQSEDRLKNWDEMLKDIMTYGYTHRPINDIVDNYMSILIGRNGHMFIYNGIHRFCCCMLSPIRQKVPVKVILCHIQWRNFRNSCSSFKGTQGRIYSQLPHPDLEQIPFHFDSTRSDLIAKHSNFPGGTLIDIGAHWGTTSYILAQHGFDVTSIEKDKNHFLKMQKVSKLPGKPFKPLHADFLEIPQKANTLVMLNIAHHFTPDPERFLTFLRKSSFSEVFYQAHAVQNKWTKFVIPRKYLRQIMNVTDMKKANMLIEIGGRKLWHLTKV